MKTKHKNSVVINVVQGKADEIVCDYKNGKRVQDLAASVVALNLSNASMCYIALRVASYMPDLDENQFRKAIRDLI